MTGSLLTGVLIELACQFIRGSSDAQRLRVISKGTGVQAKSFRGIAGSFDLPAAILKCAEIFQRAAMLRGRLQLAKAAFFRQILAKLGNVFHLLQHGLAIL